MRTKNAPKIERITLITSETDFAIRGACPSCGYPILSIPDNRLVPAPIPRAWRLIDRKTVETYAASLTDELAEWLLVMFVDSHSQLLSVETIAQGVTDEVTFDIGRIFTRALQMGAAGFILLHNHPSGSAMASAADQAVTARIRIVAEALRIQLLDHLIFASDGIRPVE